MPSKRESTLPGGSERLGFGLIGCGDIGRLRAAALGQTDTCQLVAVNDLDADRAQSVAGEYGCAVELDWRDMLNRADVGAIIVSTPPSLHAEMSVAASEAGKHVLCEKPLARNPGECRKMIEAANANGRLLATGFNYRFYPSVKKAREILDSGIIGDVVSIRSYSGYSAAEHSHPWLHDEEIMGGGALRDNGIHLIDLTHYFLGRIDTASGYTSNTVWNFEGCEDDGFALLRNIDGRVASLHASWTEQRGYRFEIELTATRGYLRFSCFPMITEVLQSGEPGKRARRKRYLFPLVHVYEHLRSYRWVVTRSFVEEFTAFKEATDGGVTPLASGYEGLVAVEVADAAARNGGDVQVARP